MLTVRVVWVEDVIMPLAEPPLEMPLTDALPLRLLIPARSAVPPVTVNRLLLPNVPTPLKVSVPAVTVVPPLYVLAAVSVVVPAPICESPPLPVIGLAVKLIPWETGLTDRSPACRYP